MTRSGSELLGRLDALAARAEARFLAQAGDASACRLDKDGRVTAGTKHAEGQLVALRSGRRLVQDALGSDEPATDREALWLALLGALSDEVADWHEMLETHRAKERPAMSWVAYAQGGLDGATAALAAARQIAPGTGGR